jgi:hypothetical protein
MQRALATKQGNRITLKKGVHQAIADFKWILKDKSSRPTRIAEGVPLQSSAEGHHDASDKGWRSMVPCTAPSSALMPGYSTHLMAPGITTAHH